jgi:hypothetical protein
VVERASQTEFAQGSHLVRVLDPTSGQRMADTLDLVGERRRLRLVVLPGQLTFIVNRVNTKDGSALDA